MGPIKRLKFKALAVCFALIATVVAQAQSYPKAIVVLIPGTLNSSVPGALRKSPVQNLYETNPYFSTTILDAFEDAGFATYVVRDLLPTGSFEENGELALKEITQWYRAHFGRTQIPMVWLGHSAGGFYALHAASINADLPLQKLVLVSTPLEGTELADQVFSSPVIGRQLQDFCQDGMGIIDLKGLPELRTSDVEKFIRSNPIESSVQIFTVAGRQSIPRFVWQEGRSEFLSPLFQWTQAWISGASDGVVSVRSANGKNAKLTSKNGNIHEVIALDGMEMPLDHVEQFLDYRILAFFGTRNADFTQVHQYKSYSELAQSLK